MSINQDLKMTEETIDKLKKIKQSFRLAMNGTAAQSMREKGLDYKINWGVSLVDLKKMAAEYGKDYGLAIELWKENIRECKILATLIMPADRMAPEIADIWMEQTHSQDMAEMAAFNLYQHLPYAPMLAYKWIADARDIYQICGYHILSRLFINGQEPNERGLNEFIDQAIAALQSDNAGLRHAASTALQRLAGLGDEYKLIVSKATKPLSQHFSTDD